MNLCEIIPDAAFLIHRDTGLDYDSAREVARIAARDAFASGVEWFTADMLADIAMKLA